jgi:hypothetical protein
MADKRELDDLLDEFLGLLQSVLSRRALVISWFYLLGCLLVSISGNHGPYG